MGASLRRLPDGDVSKLIYGSYRGTRVGTIMKGGDPVFYPAHRPDDHAPVGHSPRTNDFNLYAEDNGNT